MVIATRHRLAAPLGLAALLALTSCTTRTIGPPELERGGEEGDASATGGAAPDDAGAAPGADECVPEECPAIDDYPSGCAETRCVDGRCRYVSRDADGDGFPAQRCISRTGGVAVETGEDCDDSDEGISPNQWDGPAGEGFADACNDGIDQDCSGRVDDGRLSDGSSCTCRTGETGRCMESAAGELIDYPALDDDGLPVGRCEMGSRECLPNGTWGPCVGAVGPTPETCDGNDNDCDTIASVDDEDTPRQRFYCDRDGDGQLSSAVIPEGEPAPPEGSLIASDPGAEHVDGCAPSGPCEGRWLTASQAQFHDCDDDDPLRFVGAFEGCDGLDTDCDGRLDGANEDDDGDGHADDACAGDQARDCDDDDPLTYLGAPELCDRKDNDCMREGMRRFAGESDLEIGEDFDGDGHAPLDASCEDTSAGALARDDCDDLDERVSPSAPELCDGADNDCDGTRDELAGSTLVGSACYPVSVAAGPSHACVVQPDGEVSCWGNPTGALGRPDPEPGLAVRVPELDDALQLAGGSGFTCALHTDGHVSCWGDAYLLAPYEVSVTPPAFDRADISALSAIESITAENGRACALGGGQVHCWGREEDELLGDFSVGPQLVAHPSGRDFVDVESGSESTCAVDEDGAVWCWNRPIPSNGQPTQPPTAIPGISDATQVAVGDRHACALRQDRTVACWGDDNLDQLGPLGTGSESATPLAVTGLSDVQELAAGYGSHTCARLGNGRVKCWGNPAATADYGVALADVGWPPDMVFDALGPLQDLRQLALGADFSCALDQAGLYCWGSNASGVLTDNGLAGRYSPARNSTPSFALKAVPQAQDSCFLLPDGSLSCMGSGLAAVGAEDCDAPVPDFLWPNSEPIPVASSVADFDLGPYRLCTVTRSGGVGCDGTPCGVDPSSSWLGSPGAANVPSATAVTVGARHNCALRSDRTVYCWGDDGYDQLGGGNVALEAAALEIAAGDNHTCARLLDGSVQCWGDNRAGQLGAPPAGAQDATPRAVELPGAAVALGSAGDTSCAIVGDSRTVHCWGDNGAGQFAAPTPSNSITPITIPGRWQVAEVEPRETGVCVRMVSGSVECWGDSAPAAELPFVDAIELGCSGDSCCVVNAAGQTSCWGGVPSQCAAPAETVVQVTELGNDLWSCCEEFGVGPSCP